MTTLPGDTADSLGAIGVPATPLPGTEAAKAIEGRSLSQIAWGRLRRDRVAMVSGGFVVLLCLVAALASFIAPHLGGGPRLYHSTLIDPNIQMPLGGYGGMSSKHLLGVEPTTGRDIAARVVKGAQWSLLVSFCATALTIVLGMIGGVVAGYFGGRVDWAVNWLMAVFLAFPVLLFGIAIGAGLPTTAFGLSTNTLHIAVLIIIIGGLGWAYFGRIVRGLVLSLREREFIDAARSLGASNLRILFRELVPNLIAPTLVFASLAIPGNILAEAGFSFLGVGVQIPEPSWGNMLSDSLQYYQIDPAYLLVPGLAIFVTVLAFNLFGDGVRDAFDPRAGR